jgi:[ribosomal protein S5]-alanine N-acetyltransferase
MSKNSAETGAADVTLRALLASDEDAVYALLSDDRVIQYMLFPRFDRARAHRFTSRFQTSDPVGSPPQVVFGIAPSGTSPLIGLCGLVLDAAERQGELWYLLRPDCWGRGLITAPVHALIDHGFRNLQLHRIWASCLPENPASARVLEKLGFRQEGYHRANLSVRETWRDSYTYAVLASEWPRDRADRNAV